MIISVAYRVVYCILRGMVWYGMVWYTVLMIFVLQYRNNIVIQISYKWRMTIM
jgi:hypothetical protein